MSDNRFVEITDQKQAAIINRWLGMAEIAMKLEEVPDFQKVPGFGLAVAIVNREVSDLRSQMVMRNIKAIAAAGIDITQIKSIEFASSPSESVNLKVTMMDLADMAMEGGDV